MNRHPYSNRRRRRTKYEIRKDNQDRFDSQMRSMIAFAEQAGIDRCRAAMSAFTLMLLIERA